METLIEKIVRFEKTTDNTVKSFNRIFPESPLSQFYSDLVVDIGEISQPVTTRFITVDDKIHFKFEFKEPKKLGEY